MRVWSAPPNRRSLDGDERSAAFHGASGETESDTMSALTRRIRRLENQFGSGDSEGILLVVSTDARVLAFDENTCVQILPECGFLPTAGVSLVRKLSTLPIMANNGPRLRRSTCPRYRLHGHVDVATRIRWSRNGLVF
jgi:hypothetical protein